MLFDTTSLRIPIIPGINDNPLEPNYQGNGKGCNGSYYISKYHDLLDSIEAVDLGNAGEPYRIVSGTSEVGIYNPDSHIDFKLSGSYAGRLNADTSSVSLGYGALEVEDANSGVNTAYGTYAGNSVTTGFDNTILGSYSGLGVNTGHENTFVGSWAGSEVTVGAGNTFLGAYVGSNITTGENCTFVGLNSGNIKTYINGGYTNHSDGVGNTAIGWYNCTNYDHTGTGAFNTAIGSFAGIGNVNSLAQQLIDGATGNACNVLLGPFSKASSPTVKWEITLGSAYHTSLRVPGLGFKLGNCSAATDAQALVYSSASGTWVPGTVSGGGGGASFDAIKIYDGAAVPELTSFGQWFGAITTSTSYPFTSTIAIGKGALQSTYNDIGNNVVDTYNTVSIGVQASEYGFGNNSQTVSIGYRAGRAYSEAFGCVFVGDQVGPQQVTEGTGIWLQGAVVLGTWNATAATALDGSVIIGRNCAQNLTDGLSYNTVAIGDNAFSVATAAADSVAIGTAAGQSTTSGVHNVYIGRFAGSRSTVASENVFIGSLAGWVNGTSTAFTGTNNICIGKEAYVSTATVNNEITLGGAAISALRCAVTSITSLSDARDKADIAPLDLGLSFIKSLNPVTYKWDKREWYEGEKDGSKKQSKVNVGFLAQDLQQAQVEHNAEFMDLVYDVNPDRLEATPGNLLYSLVKAVQELEALVSAQAQEIALLKQT
jgi:hypothetical protein